jgi:thiazole synthase ThiGH ThiG subunit
VLVEGHTYTNAWIKPALAQSQKDKRAALRAAYHSLERDGVHGLSYVKGDFLLCENNSEAGCDGEATVGGTHPSDLGMRRMSLALKPHLVQALQN